MPITYISGDPLLTTAQTLAFGHNGRGRTELGALQTALLQKYPAPFAAYARLCRAGKLKPGMTWLWREAQPALLFMVIRESSVGATRLRYVQSAALKIARDYRLEGMTSLAIAPLANTSEWREIKPLLDGALRHVSLPIVIYEEILPGVKVEERLTS